MRRRAAPNVDEDRRALYLSLLVLDRFSQSPEILDHFGSAEEFLRFIDRFGGMTIKVPEREDVARLARNMHIYRSLAKSPHHRNVVRLASFYGLTDERVVQIFDEIKSAIQKLDQESGSDSDRLVFQGSELPTDQRVGG